MNNLGLLVAVVFAELHAIDAADEFGIHATRIELALVLAVLLSRSAFSVACRPVACVLFSLCRVRELACEAAALTALRPAFDVATLTASEGLAGGTFAEVRPNTVLRQEGLNGGRICTSLRSILGRNACIVVLVPLDLGLHAVSAVRLHNLAGERHEPICSGEIVHAI